MPTTPTYCPLTPQNSAEFMRANPCRHARYAEIPHAPLKGHREPRSVSVSYRASFPNGERKNGSVKALPNWNSVSTTPPPFRHTPYRFWLQPTTSVWRSLLHCPHNDWTFTFSAKERDPETGLSYFGSRYYSSDLSIWLSVDPMSDKYASLSPYVYCADNPVKLVDPNGEDVFICGASPDSKSDAEAAEKAFEYLVGSAKNLSLERDSKTGRLSATIKEGAQLSEDEQILYDAIMDQEVVVNLSVSINNLYKGRATEFGAGFYGNKLGENASGLGHAFAFTDQFVCLPVLKQNYFESDIGGVIMHEITESHYGGCASLVSGIAAEMAIGDTPAYVAAHNNAAPCPPSAETKICQMLNISRKQYNDLKSKLNGYNSFK